MFQKITTLLIILTSLICLKAFSQSKDHPKDYFRSPLDIPLALSGNFGELRSNHFHSGFDIKTEGVEGKKVYAVADGYISRIKVSPWGYGNALYITHPNGYVSMYAHLRNYNDSIQKYVKIAQYLEETFEIELFPAKGELPVKKGDIIAFSGNTGGSGAPHLHFEIRDEKTEKPINPLLFGYKIADNIKPILKELIIYPIDSSSFVNSSRLPKKVLLAGTLGNYKIGGEGTTVVAQGNIGFGIEAYDLNSSVSNKVGVYSIELKVDNERIYYYEMEQFGFDENRYINCHLDYYECRKNKSFYQKSFLAPNNKLNIYKNIKNNGIWNFSDDSIHTVQYIVRDYTGNASTATFKIQSKPKGIIKESANIMVGKPKISPWFKEVFKYDRENVFQNDYITVDFPANIFYEDLYFEYHASDTIKGAVTATHHIHNEYVPVHFPYLLSIKTGNLSPAQRKKALIVSIDERGNKTPMESTFQEDRITCTPKILGAFTVMIDSVKPIIKPVNIPANKNLAGVREIKIRIGDNLSGIKTYRATIDGKWVGMEYEPKLALLTYIFEKDLKPGKHTFNLEVKDGSGNTTVYNTEFTR